MSLHPLIARPRTLEQASEVLGNLSTGAMIIAGGQELMPSINYGALMPDVFVDIGQIEALKGITEKDDLIHIGALTVHRDIQDSELLQAKLPLLSRAVTEVGGGLQVHNRGTIGGNIVSMHPLYDILPPLLALGAEVDLLRDGEEKRCSLAELMKDTGHGLGSDALLVRVVVKSMASNLGWAYEKLKISAGGYGSANAAVTVAMDGGKIGSLHAVVGAVSDLPEDISSALENFLGEVWSDTLADKIEAQVSNAIGKPLSDHQGDGEWRRAMGGVVVRRAIEAAIKKAGEG